MSEEWKAAARDEFEKFRTASTIIKESEVPAGCQVIPPRIVLDIKRDKDGKIIKLKVRMTARGDKLNYNGPVFAQGYNKDALRVLLATGAALGLQIDQADVTAAYLAAPARSYLCQSTQGPGGVQHSAWICLSLSQRYLRYPICWSNLVFVQPGYLSQPAWLYAAGIRAIYLSHEG